MSSVESNMPQRRMPDRKPEGPRRVRHGIKLRNVYDFGLSAPANTSAPSIEPAAPTHPIADQWFSLISQRIERPTLLAGYEYAKAGQIVRIEWQTGLIEATVQGTAPRPYGTRIGFPHFSELQWKRVVESMSGEAVYLAKFLSNELPAALNELLASHGLTLLPVDPMALDIECTCTDPKPCKHAAAVAMLATEKLADEPLQILSWLGMGVDQLIEHLRRVRAIHARGSASAHGDPLIPESQIEPSPLEACIDDFWHAGRDVEELAHWPSSHHANHALLRRLGPSPISSRFPIVGLLASVYDTVSAAAREIRDRGESTDLPRE
jgi:uncharacterized Zn finger protein